MRPIGEDIGDYYPVVYIVFAQFTQSVEMLQTRYSTQTWGEVLLFTSITDLLFSFLLSLVGRWQKFFLKDFNILCLWPNWYVQISGTFLPLSSKTKKAGRSTAFVHTCQYNQHEMKVSWRGFNDRPTLNLQLVWFVCSLQTGVCACQISLVRDKTPFL